MALSVTLISSVVNGGWKKDNKPGRKECQQESKRGALNGKTPPAEPGNRLASIARYKEALPHIASLRFRFPATLME
ncbi:hypothetical protein NDU88_002495 [Pleurodeles waltl]|uniref:Uncharacterized protein n=1 Tax=Pleurodeles waltl TaxID=8319 RepID=A0AAV7W0T9_PLEWA|nr:hypothetical protein NDU88_002495 [Pleurodeles waltl]